MKNGSLDKLRGPVAIKGRYLLLLMTIIGFLLAVPSSTFAKPLGGNKPSVTATATATIATFVDISQDSTGKSIYPRNRNSKNLKVGDILDFVVNGLVETGKYEGNNQVTLNGQALTLTFSNEAKPLPILDLQPLSMSFVGSRDCQKQETVFVCTAKVSSRKSAQSNLNWIAYTDFSNKVVFDPPFGSVPPGQSVKINVEVPINACPAISTRPLFYFQSSRNTHTITWACNPKT